MKTGIQVIQDMKDIQIYSKSMFEFSGGDGVTYIFSTEVVLFIGIIIGKVHLLWKRNIYVGKKIPPLAVTLRNPLE